MAVMRGMGSFFRVKLFSLVPNFESVPQRWRRRETGLGLGDEFKAKSGKGHDGLIFGGST
jgi:hypothetical protein